MQKRIYSIFLIFILFLPAFLFFAPGANICRASSENGIKPAAAEKNVKVLLINSYNQNLPWTRGITDAIEDALKHEPGIKCELHIEYLDTKNYFTDQYLLKIRDIFALKYDRAVFDAVISSDDDAFNFCAKNQDELFKGAPLIFCGVNNFEPALIAGKNISGVVEAFDIKSNLELIKKIQPEVKKIYVINDTTTTGEANKIIFGKNAEVFKSVFSFEYLQDLSMAEVCDKISRLEAGSVIFLMTFNRDKNGTVFSYDESIRLISAASSVPIYGVWDFYLGGGITGGLMISARSQGETAAKITAGVIKSGKKASDFEVIKTSPNRYMFDHNMLQKHKISEKFLPENSFILNQPFSFYSVDKNTFWFIIVLIMILVILSSFLIMNVLERRAAEKELLLVNAKLENIINELENIVEKRTCELLDTNKNLKQQIAGREKIEKQLLASETKYRMLAENAFDVIFETDLNGAIIYVSPNFKDIFNDSPEEQREKNYDFVAYTDDGPVIKDMFETIARLGYANEIIFRNAAFDSNPLWFESSGKVFTAADGLPHIVIVTRNVTERKKIEDEMIKNAKLESLGLLAGGIAHDFNNVLMGIIGNITLAKRRCGDTGIAEILSRAERVSYRAKSLTEQLITFSKGGMPIKKLTDINELMLEAVQFSLSGSSMKSEFLLEPSLRHIDADEGQLIQVITNITINARQACGENGLITFKTENIDEINAKNLPLPDGDYIKITIIDNGRGIEAPVLKNIFDPYFTTKPDGRGIGLAAAHSIVKNHNGIIEVESKPGAGTTFNIFLPAGRTL